MKKRDRFEVMYEKSKKSRSSAIKYFCWQCCGYGSINPNECGSYNCAFYDFRTTLPNGSAAFLEKSRAEAVRSFCRDCVGGNPKVLCSIGQISKKKQNGCPLYRWRYQKPKPQNKPSLQKKSKTIRKKTR